MNSFLQKVLFLVIALAVAGLPVFQCAAMPLQDHAHDVHSGQAAMAATPHWSSIHHVHIADAMSDKNDAHKSPCPMDHCKHCMTLCCCVTSLPVAFIAEAEPIFPTKPILHHIEGSKATASLLVSPMRKPPRPV